MIVALACVFMQAIAQTDTVKIFEPHDSKLPAAGDERFKTKLPKALIVPGIMIGYGLTTIKNHGIYSSYQAREDVQKYLGGAHSTIDNALVFAPYAEFAALTLAKVKCRNDLTNVSLLILKSEVLMAAIVFPMKSLTHQERPYSYQMALDGVPLEKREENKNAFQSLPSGHTAQAFLAASIVHKEFRYQSPWYGVGAYALAGSVGIFRMINDKHWESDVLVGAGIGILSTHIVYATHRFKWGKPQICFVPIFGKKEQGFRLAYTF
jgi:membrane-associated phospholipid phosphatase